MKVVKYKFYLGILVLSAFLAAFFLCDAFKKTHDSAVEHHNEYTIHHQSMVLALAPTPTDYSVLKMLASVFAGLLFITLSPVLVGYILLTATLWFLLFHNGRLRSYFLYLFSSGILNPKLY